MKTVENTHLTLVRLGKGHFKVTAESGSETGSIVTSDSLLIDDAFNSDEDDCCYYDSPEEARQVLINNIFE